jgi:hypothetical protein
MNMFGGIGNLLGGAIGFGMNFLQGRCEMTSRMTNHRSRAQTPQRRRRPTQNRPIRSSSTTPQRHADALRQRGIELAPAPGQPVQ